MLILQKTQEYSFISNIFLLGRNNMFEQLDGIPEKVEAFLSSSVLIPIFSQLLFLRYFKNRFIVYVDA